jgi:hypothetical protein
MTESKEADRNREDIFRELTLLLEAKKNINSILTTMYSVFFSVSAFLIYAFYTLTSMAGRITVSLTGAAIMFGLMLVTIRAEGTNRRCDVRAQRLEKAHDLEILSTYDNTAESGRLNRITMHGTLTALDVLLGVFWIILAVLVIAHVV